MSTCLDQVHVTHWAGEHSTGRCVGVDGERRLQLVVMDLKYFPVCLSLSDDQMYLISTFSTLENTVHLYRSDYCVLYYVCITIISSSFLFLFFHYHEQLSKVVVL